MEKSKACFLRGWGLLGAERVVTNIWVRAFEAEVRPSALRWKWTLYVQGKTIGCVSLEHGGKVEREKEIRGTPKMPKHQISQSIAGFCFYWSEKRSTGGFEQRGMPWSDWRFIYVFDLTTLHVGSYFPNQGSNLCPLQQKNRLWTTGPPGTSLS